MVPAASRGWGGEGLHRGVISKGPAFCLGQGHMTRTFTMCSWVHWGCGVEFWAKAQGLECPVYLPWPQRGCVG